jgi:uncharacterized protein
VPEQELHPAVRVQPSEIAGRGLFATEGLSSGSVVLRLAGGSDRVDGLGSSFPNHCCDANIGWLDELTLVTMTDVAAGAELVTDYAMSIVEPEWLLRCHCPSYRCRQMVEGTDWRIPQLQARYDGWWAPHAQRLVDASRRASSDPG